MNTFLEAGRKCKARCIFPLPSALWMRQKRAGCPNLKHRVHRIGSLHSLILWSFAKHLKHLPTRQGSAGSSNRSDPQTMAEAEMRIDIPKAEGDQVRMDNELLKALKRGDARTVERFFSRETVSSEAEQGRRRSRPGATKGGNSALHIAAGFGHFELTNLICARDSSLLTVRNAGGETPLHCAARAGADRIVSLFISEAHRCEEEVLRAADREGKTALHAAAEEGHVKVAEVLMSADPGLAAVVDDSGVSPLYAAVLSESLEVVQVLIGSRADGGDAPEASYAGPNGQTALHAAAYRNPEIINKLLGWKPALATKADNSGSTFLHYLAATTRTDAVQQLLKCDTSTAYLSDGEGYFPIHVAASVGRHSIALVLIDHCNDMDELVDKEGRNFLHIAAQFDEPAIVELVCRQPLLAKMMNARDYKGNTPLHLAAKSKNQRIVSLLSGNKKVHHSIINKDGLTPIELVITQQKPGLVGAQDQEDWIIQCLQRIGAVCGPRRLDPLQSLTATRPGVTKLTTTKMEAHQL